MTRNNNGHTLPTLTVEQFDAALADVLDREKGRGRISLEGSGTSIDNSCEVDVAVQFTDPNEPASHGYRETVRLVIGVLGRENIRERAFPSTGRVARYPEGGYTFEGAGKVWKSASSAARALVKGSRFEVWAEAYAARKLQDAQSEARRQAQQLGKAIATFNHHGVEPGADAVVKLATLLDKAGPACDEDREYASNENQALVEYYLDWPID